MTQYYGNSIIGRKASPWFRNLLLMVTPILFTILHLFLWGVKIQRPKETAEPQKVSALTELVPFDTSQLSVSDCEAGLVEQSRGLLSEGLGQIIQTLPLEDTESLDQQLWHSFLKEYSGRVSDDVEWGQYLDLLLYEVVAVMDLPVEDLTIYYVEDDEVLNAFSFPGGQIVVFSGLLNKVIQNEAQLVGLIAHEIAHIYFNHARPGQKLMQGLKDQVGSFGSVIAVLLAHPFKLGQEKEADTFALKTLVSMAYHPFEFVTFLENLPESEWRSDRGLLREAGDLLSSHPSKRRRACLAKNQILFLAPDIPELVYVGKKNYYHKNPKWKAVY